MHLCGDWLHFEEFLTSPSTTVALVQFLQSVILFQMHQSFFCNAKYKAIYSGERGMDIVWYVSLLFLEDTCYAGGDGTQKELLDNIIPYFQDLSEDFGVAN